MFESLMQMFRDVAGDSDDSNVFSDGDHRVAAAALLVHLIAIDGVIEPEEQAKMRDILKQRFSLSDSDTSDLIAVASKRDDEAVDLYSFTSKLKHQLDEEGRIEIIEMMWELVFADGKIHEFEDNLVWRVSELMGVSRRDRIRTRQNVQAQNELDQTEMGDG
ncbi:TerB family tellurite resistance protein [Cohaesibacter celericrescens]|uniref:Co-chaperone DjlA N-terminal domain-containing protein n=1 Tax=Cohaesibacter celericrescens TaxID=2067669 RepID=A0A2N5XPD6_9HYPH|nr:TerB family tellurite resistance protein [Cohaesibacter celericrescens]PLW76297.1 hypothetical protein C0081_15500 [Cohaesibacter celericrescens]